MRVVNNPDKYLSKDLVESFFELGKINHVDKTLCGNGATTAFLNTWPKSNKTKILIAPNKGVVVNKQQQYSGSYSFIYQESDDIIYGSSFVIIVANRSSCIVWQIWFNKELCCWFNCYSKLEKLTIAERRSAHLCIHWEEFH